MLALIEAELEAEDSLYHGGPTVAEAVRRELGVDTTANAREEVIRRAVWTRP